MRKAEHRRYKLRTFIFFLTGLIIIAADQLTKNWIRVSLAPGQSLFDTGFFRIVRVHNTGAAFGIFPDQNLALIIFALVGIAVLFVYIFVVYRNYPSLDSLLGRIGFGMILGGTIGNLIDRLYFGYVTDFLDFSYWPAFNVADPALIIGILLFAYSLLGLLQTEKYHDRQGV